MDNKSFQEIKNRSLFARLKRLFSNEIIVRNIGGKKLKVVDVNSTSYATDRNSLRDRFNRLRVSASDNYSRDFNLAFQRNRVEIFRDYDCITGDTLIPLPGGENVTIKQLAEVYADKPHERFSVFSFDPESDYTTIGQAFHPRSKGLQKIWKVNFSNGGSIKATLEHPFLMKCGNYKLLKDLQVNDSVMCNNHPQKTIQSINFFGEDEVFDLSVDKYHNFSTDECFIHNCMDMDPILHSALDIYADESTTQNEYGDVLKIYSSDEAIKDTLENLFYDILNIEHNLWSWVRNLVKYGDFYLRLYISPEYGVYMVKPYSAYHVNRIENSDLSNRNYVKFQVTIPEGNRLEELNNYEMVHFRLISDSNFLPQGLSVLEGARRIWKQLCVAKNSKLWTPDGYKNVQDIHVGDDVFAFDKTTNKAIKTKVTAHNKTGTNVEVITIKTKNRTLNVTPNHKLLVKASESNALIYKEAKDIIASETGKSDHLVFPSLDTGTESYTTNIDYNNLGVKAFYQFTTTPEFVQLLGFLFNRVNPTALFNQNVVSWELTGNNIIDSEYARLFDIVFPDEKLEINATTKIATCNSEKVKNTLINLSTIKSNTSGLYNCIPEWIFTLCKHNRKQFIYGLYDSMCDKKTYSISSMNESYITQIKTLCEMTGILCSEASTHQVRNNFNQIFNIYVINVNLGENYDVRFENICSVTLNTEKTDVYNLTVEHPEHNYVLEGIVSSNCLMEDAMLIHRIMRAPEKRIFKIDVGNIPPNEIDNHMTRIIDTMKKVPYVDQQTGDYNLRFNLQNMVDDFYIPVRGGDSGTSIETLKGLDWTGTDDVEYLRNKMMSALKMSKASLGYGEDTSGKATLSALDIRFGRTVQRIQRFILSGLKEIAIIHLFTQGFRDERLLDFDIYLTNPSTVFIKEQLEIFSTKMDVAQKMQDAKMFSRKWIYENIFDLSEQEIIDNQKEMVDDSKSNYRFSQIEEEGTDPVVRFLKTKQGNANSSNDAGDDAGDDSGFGGDSFGGGSFGGGLGGDSSNDEDIESDSIGNEEENESGEYTDTDTEETDDITKQNKKNSEKLAEDSADDYKKYQFKPSTVRNKIRISKNKKKEWDLKRDQTGRKETRKYPFGEDPLGDMENRRKVKLNERQISLTSKHQAKRMEKELSSLMQAYTEDTKKVLMEDLNTKISYMDEKILE